MWQYRHLRSLGNPGEGHLGVNRFGFKWSSPGYISFTWVSSFFSETESSNSLSFKQICLEYYLLGWPKSSFGVFFYHLMENSNYLFGQSYTCNRALQVVLVVKNLPANAIDGRDVGSIPGSGRSPGGGHDNPVQYSCLESPVDREAGRLQSIKSQRVGHDWSDLAHIHAYL